MNNPKVVFSIVHYLNAAEVQRFCNQLKGYKGFLVLVTDNSGDLDRDLLSENCLVFKPPSNLGYLNGCAYGLANYMSEFDTTPECVCVCNTDIVFRKGLSNLEAIDISDESVGCIAPKILLPNGHQQNPNLLRRPNRKRIAFLVGIHRYRLLGAIYMLLSQAKKTILPRRRAINEPMRIYSCHGACMFLTRHFFEMGGYLHYGGFLHEEELHIAEQLRNYGLQTVYNPQIEILHYPHSSLGSVRLLRQSMYHRDSLNWIRSQYF